MGPQGFLNMAKARRSMGRNSVSVLDTREEYSAEVTISMSVRIVPILARKTFNPRSQYPSYSSGTSRRMI